MSNRIWIVVVALLLSLRVGAVELDSLNRDSGYVASIVKRSEKIVDGLNVADAAARQEVVNIIANRYFQLNDIYSARDKKVAEAKETLIGDAKNAALAEAKAEADAALYRSHFAFPAALSLWLSNEQIEGVKDGMTFNVLNVTYAAHLDMVPTLKEEEKAQIYAWLVEAREYAMDAENSKKKHETFGKYKGRINNYLTKQGYNLTKEREAWAERVKARGGTL
jgi:hypothetical protein